MDRDVVITGIGIATPHGYTVRENLGAWWSGHPAFAPIRSFDTEGTAVRYGGECVDLDARPLPQRKLRKMVNRKDLLAVTTCHAAMEDAGRLGLSHDPNRSACFIGACSSQLGDIAPYFDAVLQCVSDDRECFDSGLFGKESLGQVNPLAAIKVLMNGSLAHISQQYDLRGPNGNFMDFSLSGLEALEACMLAIREDRADWGIVGAMAAPFDPFQVADAWHRGELATQEDLSEEEILAAVKPFDQSRRGTVLSEASLFLVVEERSYAKARGASSKGRILACSLASEGAMSPPPSGGSHALARSMTGAMEKGAVRPERLAAVIGHANGTLEADGIEARTYADWLPDRSVRIASLKGATGETSEASALLGIVAAFEGLERGEVPPTRGFEKPMPAARDLCLSGQPQKVHGDVAAVTVRSPFGGAATVLVARE